MLIYNRYKPQQIISQVSGLGAADVTGTYKGESVSGESYVELAGTWR